MLYTSFTLRRHATPNNRSLIFLFVGLLVLWFLASPMFESQKIATASPHMVDLSRVNHQTATGDPSQAQGDGWASFGVNNLNQAGTTGGASASQSQIYTVTTRLELVNALSPNGVLNTAPKIIYIVGTIDANVDDLNNPLGLNDYAAGTGYDFNAYLVAYDPATYGKNPPAGPQEQARIAAQKNQEARVVIEVGANTTIIGRGANAKLRGANLLITADNVIIRNVIFEDAYDYFPQWNPTDEAAGNWDPAYENITMRGATHVWIDHCEFSDGERPDSLNQTYFGRPYQRHSDAVDITRESNYVTLSYNYFHDHDRAIRIGASDSATADSDKLKVTIHHNYYQNIVQRLPRVRFGQVHIYNNYIQGDRKAVNYTFSHVFGIGFKSQMYVENNYFEIANLESPARLLANNGGSAFYDNGQSIVNGATTDLFKAAQSFMPTLSKDVGWSPNEKYTYSLDFAASAKAKVLAMAGVGKLDAPAPSNLMIWLPVVKS